MAKNNWMEKFLRDEKNVQAAASEPKVRVYSPSPSLNWALKVEHGYTTCLYGPEGSGKSLLSMIYAGAMMQADEEACAVLITTEMRVPSPDRLKILGVDPDRLLIRQANTLHDVFDWAVSKDEVFINSDGSKSGPGLLFAMEQGFPVKALIIDSIKGISGPRELAAATVEKDIMGDLSRFLNPALRSLLPVVRKYDLMTIFVQQVSMNMDPDDVKYRGRKWIVPSGQSLKHFCENMVLLERVESKDSKIFDETSQSIRELPVQRGHTIRCKVEKANLYKPFREAEFRLDYDLGVVQTGLEVATLAANYGVITHPLNDKGGEIKNQWQFSHDGYQKKWIGFASVVDEAEENSELRGKLMAAVEEADIRRGNQSEDAQ